MGVLRKLIEILIKSSIISLLFIPSTITFAHSYHWKEVTPSESGRQWIDINSIETLSENKIYLVSRYLPAEKVQSSENNFITYSMEVDCLNKTYRDASINGQIQKKHNWLDPHGDILINETIKLACSDL